MKRHYLTSTAAICGLTLALVGWAPPASAGTVSISAAQALPGTVDMTAEGTVDWRNWAHPDQKDAGGGTPVGLIGSSTPDYNQFDMGADLPTTFTWTDGVTTPSGSSQYILFAEEGYTFTVAAAAETRTLNVYLGTFEPGNPNGTVGQLTATLSGGRSDVQTNVSLPSLATNDGGAYGVIPIEFSGEGQTLTVEWVRDVANSSGNGYNMQLIGATLATP